MKPILIIFIGLCTWIKLPAQLMELQVVGACGGVAQAGGGTLHWTAGETAITPRAAAALYWGEGFQQAWETILVSTGNPIPVQPVSLRVYPNPAGRFLFVESDMPIQARLFGPDGRPVAAPMEVNGRVQADLSHLPAGWYILHALDESGRVLGAAKVQHIQ